MPACKTQLNPPCYPTGRMGRSGGGGVRLWPEDEVRSTQPGGGLEEGKGRMRAELPAPVPGMGSSSGQAACLGCRVQGERGPCLGARMRQGGEQAG